MIANLLDNSVSFSQDNQKIEIGLEETSSNLLLSVKDEGPGFSETSPQKIFKRFYSNRPASFGTHSGLGLNIVKNIVQFHFIEIFITVFDQVFLVLSNDIF